VIELAALVLRLAQLRLRFPKHLRLWLLLDPQAPIELEHQLLRRFVGDFQQGRDHAALTGHLQRLLQARDTLTRASLADVRVAGTEHRELAAREIERRELVGCHETRRARSS
jgi:hypothetical protein